MGKTNIENTNEKSYLKEVKSELKKVKVADTTITSRNFFI